MSRIVRTAMIGCGGMARWHVQTMPQQANTTQITVVCEPHRSMRPNCRKFHCRDLTRRRINPTSTGCCESTAIGWTQPSSSRRTPFTMTRPSRVWKRAWTCSWKSRW